MTTPNQGIDPAFALRIVAQYGSPDKVPDSVLQYYGISRQIFNTILSQAQQSSQPQPQYRQPTEVIHGSAPTSQPPTSPSPSTSIYPNIQFNHPALPINSDVVQPQQGQGQTGIWQDLGSMFGGVGDMFSSIKHTADTINGLRYPEPNPIVNGHIVYGASPNDPAVKEAQKGLLGDFGSIVHTVFPDASNPITNPFDTPPAPAGPAAGSGLQDVTPMPGGVQYGVGAGYNNSGDPSAWKPPGSDGSSDYSSGIGSDLPAAPSYSDYIKNLVAPTLQDIPDAPAYTPIVAKDFTPQASKMAATAYSPAFAAIDLGVSNAKQNYANSDAQIKGIYEDLGKALLANQAASDTRFAGQKKASQADTLAAQRQAAALNKAGGAVISTAAGANPEFGADLARSANSDTNSQINALAQTGLRNLGAQQILQNSAANQQTSYEDAAQHQGAYTRQQLSFDLADLLTGYDQQRLNLTSDEKNRILDLANTLSNNDINIQGQNQSNKMGAYQQAVAAIQARNSNAQTGYQNQVNAADTAFKNDYGSWNDQANMAIKLQEDANQQAQFLKSEADKLYMNAQDNQTGILKAAAGSAASKEPNDPMGKFTYAVNNYFTDGQGNLNVDASRGTVNNIIDLWYSYQGQGQKPNAQAFQQKAVNMAQQWGIPPQTALAAASAFLYSGLATGYGSAASLSSGGN